MSGMEFIGPTPRGITAAGQVGEWVKLFAADSVLEFSYAPA